MEKAGVLIPLGNSPGTFLLSVLFYDFQLEIIKIQYLYKIVLRKPYLGKSLKIFNIGIQPDGGTKIKFMTDGVQGVKHFFCPAVSGIVTDYRAF